MNCFRLTLDTDSIILSTLSLIENARKQVNVAFNLETKHKATLSQQSELYFGFPHEHKT